MDATGLTSREREALRYLSKGYNRTQTAHMLSISRTTLRVHIHNARKKLGATSDQDAIARATVGELLKPIQQPDGMPPQWAALTPRELEVLFKLTNGFYVRTDVQLAGLLVVSLATIRKHLQNIYRKLDIPNRASAALLAAKAFASTALSGAATTEQGAQ